MRRSTVTRFLAGTMGLVIFLTNAALAHAAESNFWAERRYNRNKRRDSTLQAGLPTSSSAGDFLKQLPSLDLHPLTPSLAEVVAKDLPRGFAEENAGLLKALPYAFGSIRRISLPAVNASRKVVIHIQDVHQNQEAQRNIGRAVQSLVDGDQVGLVALEGAFEPINLSGLRAFSRRDILHKVAEYLLRVNKISGPVYAALTGAKPFPAIVGVDDPAHYGANVEAYRRSARDMKANKDRLAAVGADLERRKATAFSPGLLSFDRQVQSHRDGKTGLGEHLKALAARASARELTPAVRDFLDALSMESSLDFKRVDAERTALVERLVQKLDKDRIDALLRWSAAYRAGQIRYGDFYKSLRGLCEENEVSLSGFPAMDQYIRYVLSADRIDAESLMRDMTALEEAVYARLAKTPDEARLIGQSNGLALAAKLLDFSLTPEEYGQYAFADHAGLGDLSAFEAFYKEARARDQAMADNLLKAMEANKSRIAVLVTGGYHSPGMAERLKRAGVIVISFTPKLEKIDTARGSAYLSVFTQEKTPLENLFQGQKLFLATEPTEALRTGTIEPLIADAAAESEVRAQRAKDAATDWKSGRWLGHLDERVRQVLDDFQADVEKTLGHRVPFGFEYEVKSMEAAGEDIRITMSFKTAGREYEVTHLATFNDKGFLEVRTGTSAAPLEAARGILRPLAAPAARRVEDLLKTTGNLTGHFGVPGPLAETHAGLFRHPATNAEKGRVLTAHRIEELPNFITEIVQQEMLGAMTALDGLWAASFPERWWLAAGIPAKFSGRGRRRGETKDLSSTFRDHPLETLLHIAINRRPKGEIALYQAASIGSRRARRLAKAAAASMEGAAAAILAAPVAATTAGAASLANRAALSISHPTVAAVRAGVLGTALALTGCGALFPAPKSPRTSAGEVGPSRHQALIASLAAISDPGFKEAAGTVVTAYAEGVDLEAAAELFKKNGISPALLDKAAAKYDEESYRDFMETQLRGAIRRSREDVEGFVKTGAALYGWRTRLRSLNGTPAPAIPGVQGQRAADPMEVDATLRGLLNASAPVQNQAVNAFEAFLGLAPLDPGTGELQRGATPPAVELFRDRLERVYGTYDRGRWMTTFEGFFSTLWQSYETPARTARARDVSYARTVLNLQEEMIVASLPAAEKFAALLNTRLQPGMRPLIASLVIGRAENRGPEEILQIFSVMVENKGSPQDVPTETAEAYLDSYSRQALRETADQVKDFIARLPAIQRVLFIPYVKALDGVLPTLMDMSDDFQRRRGKEAPPPPDKRKPGPPRPGVSPQYTGVPLLAPRFGSVRSLKKTVRGRGALGSLYPLLVLTGGVLGAAAGLALGKLAVPAGAALLGAGGLGALAGAALLIGTVWWIDRAAGPAASRSSAWKRRGLRTFSAYAAPAAAFTLAMSPIRPAQAQWHDVARLVAAAPGTDQGMDLLSGQWNRIMTQYAFSTSPQNPSVEFPYFVRMTPSLGITHLKLKGALGPADLSIPYISFSVQGWENVRMISGGFSFSEGLAMGQMEIVGARHPLLNSPSLWVDWGLNAGAGQAKGESNSVRGIFGSAHVGAGILQDLGSRVHTNLFLETTAGLNGAAAKASTDIPDRTYRDGFKESDGSSAPGILRVDLTGGVEWDMAGPFSLGIGGVLSPDAWSAMARLSLNLSEATRESEARAVMEPLVKEFRQRGRITGEQRQKMEEVMKAIMEDKSIDVRTTLVEPYAGLLYESSLGLELIRRHMPRFLENHDLFVQARRLGIESPDRVSDEDLVELLRNRTRDPEEARQDPRPMAFIAIAPGANDWNKAFMDMTWEFVHKFIAHGYQVMYYEAWDPDPKENVGIPWAIRDAESRTGRKALAEIVGGHGTEETVALGPGRYLNVDDPAPFQALGDGLEKGGIMFFYACSTGKGEGMNIARTARRYAPQAEVIYAPRIPAGTNLYFDTNEKPFPGNYNYAHFAGGGGRLLKALGFSDREIAEDIMPKWESRLALLLFFGAPFLLLLNFSSFSPGAAAGLAALSGQAAFALWHVLTGFYVWNGRDYRVLSFFGPRAPPAAEKRRLLAQYFFGSLYFHAPFYIILSVMPFMAGLPLALHVALTTVLLTAALRWAEFSHARANAPGGEVGAGRALAAAERALADGTRPKDLEGLRREVPRLMEDLLGPSRTWTDQIVPDLTPSPAQRRFLEAYADARVELFGDAPAEPELRAGLLDRALRRTESAGDILKALDAEFETRDAVAVVLDTFRQDHLETIVAAALAKSRATGKPVIWAAETEALARRAERLLGPGAEVPVLQEGADFLHGGGAAVLRQAGLENRTRAQWQGRPLGSLGIFLGQEWSFVRGAGTPLFQGATVLLIDRLLHVEALVGDAERLALFIAEMA